MYIGEIFSIVHTLTKYFFVTSNNEKYISKNKKLVSVSDHTQVKHMNDCEMSFKLKLGSTLEKLKLSDIS